MTEGELAKVMSAQGSDDENEGLDSPMMAPTRRLPGQVQAPSRFLNSP